MTRIRISIATAAAAALAACGSPQSPAPEPAPIASKTGPGLTTGEAPPAEAPAPAPAPKRAWPAYDAVPEIPLEVLLGNPTKVRPQLSPDGKRMAYLAPEEGVLNIWVQTVGKPDAVAVTHDRKRGIRSYFWAPNGKQLLYVQDKGGDENWHVWAVDAAGGEPRDLTPIDGVQAQILAVEHKIPNKILVGLNDRNPMLHDVYSLDLKTGKRTLVQQNDITAIAWIADHKLRVRAAVTLSPDGGAALQYRAGGKGPFTELTKWGAEDMFTTHPAGFAANNRTLYMLSSVGSNTTQLRAFDVKSKREKVIFKDDTYDVTGVLSHPTKYTIQAVAVERDRTTWTVLDKSVAKDFEALAAVDDGDLSVVSRDRRDKTWLVAFSHDDGPVVYYAYDRKTRKATRLFSHRPELEDLTLAEMKPVSWKARDGLEIHGYLTLPPKVEPKALPAVVYVHGGPWARDSWGFDPTAQWLANRGYAVLQPNYRGSTGYGKSYINAADKEWGGKMQDDITDGTRWLIDQGIADPERICIMGGSYGGYATLMGLVREPDLYACGVDIVGVANLFTWMKTIPPYWRPFVHVLYQRVGHPEKDKELLEQRSPVFQVDKIKAPLLIGQGANDPRVPKAESTQIRDALRNAGKTVEYIEFPDEGHGFARPENRLKFYEAAEKFLAEHIGGRAP